MHRGGWEGGREPDRAEGRALGKAVTLKEKGKDGKHGTGEPECRSFRN